MRNRKPSLIYVIEECKIRSSGKLVIKSMVVVFRSGIPTLTTETQRSRRVIVKSIWRTVREVGTVNYFV